MDRSWSVPMLADAVNRILHIEERDVGLSVVCPVCNRYFRPNGTGPASVPLFTRILQMMPSEDYLGGFPPYVHDLAYLLCPEGWTIVVHLDNTFVTITNREQADKVYLRLMLRQVMMKTEPGLRRKYMRGLAYRNYKAVCVGGSSSYKHKH